MKILHITSYGYSGGGAENYLNSINTVLSKRGHDVMVISSDRKHNSLPNFSNLEFKAIGGRSPLARLFAHIFNLSAYKIVQQVLKEYRPDIVHFHVMSEVSPAPLLLIKRYPTVMTVHGHETFINPLLPWCLDESLFYKGAQEPRYLKPKGYLFYAYFRIFQRSFYRQLLRNVDLFVFPSNWMAKISEKSLGKAGSVIPNGIVQQKSVPLHKKNNILYVGRLTAFKGIEQLVRAMRLVVDEVPTAHLDIAGDGAMANRLHSIISELNLKNNIKLHGRVQHNKLPTLYNKTKLVVIPSLVPESFCLVGVEALSAARPVVASGSGGMSEWLEEGQNGLRCNATNPEDIALKVVAILKNPVLAQQMSKKAGQMSSQFSIEKHVDNLETAYSQLTNMVTVR